MCLLEKIKKQLTLLITVIALIFLNGCNEEEAEKDDNTYQVALEYDASSGDVTVDPVMQRYPENTIVTLTASPKEGYKFLGWKSNGVIISTQEEISFNIGENVDIMACFESDDITTSGETFSLDVSYDAAKGNVKIAPDKSKYDKDETVTITATPKEGYKFKEWHGISGSSNVLNIQMTEDKEITAIFEKAGNVIVTMSDIVFGFDGSYDETTGKWKFTAYLEDDLNDDTYITDAAIKINDTQMNIDGTYYELEMENLGPEEDLNISVKHRDIDYSKTIKTPPYFTDKRNLLVDVEYQNFILDWQQLECNGYMVYKSFDYAGSNNSGKLTSLPISENHFEVSKSSLLHRDFANNIISPDRVLVWIIPVNYDKQLEGFHDSSSIKLEGKKGNVMVWDASNN